jgi:hypothetical protein
VTGEEARAGSVKHESSLRAERSNPDGGDAGLLRSARNDE